MKSKKILALLLLSASLQAHGGPHPSDAYPDDGYSDDDGGGSGGSGSKSENILGMIAFAGFIWLVLKLNKD